MRSVTSSVVLMTLVVVIAVNLGLVHAAATAAASTKHHPHHRTLCPVCHFRNHMTGQCTPCDLCPPNQVIRSPCTRHRNTVCGVFHEFHELKFKLAPLTKHELVNNEVPATQDENGEHSWASGNQLIEEHGVSTKHQQHPQPESHDGGHRLMSVTRDSSWKVLTLSLIGVLVLVSVFLFVFVFMACYLLKRNTRQDKQLLSHSDCDNRSFHPFVYMEDGIRGDKQALKRNEYVLDTTCAQPGEEDGISDLEELLDDDDHDDNLDETFQLQIATTDTSSPSARSNPFSPVTSEVTPTTPSSQLFHIIHNPLSLEHHPSLAAGSSSQQDYVYFNPPVSSYLMK